MPADADPTRQASRTPTHLDLLAISRVVQRAVIDDDTEQLHAALSRLRADLVLHLRGEHQWAGGGQGAGAGVVKDGQHRLLGLIDEVILDAHSDEAGCACLVRATVIERALRRQAKLEAAVLDRPR